ncbi:MAG: hypothetical protein ACREOW_05245 [Thermodesulfobacteriota bacterium]
MRPLLILMLLGFLGCVSEDEGGQNFGDIFDTPEGTVLTQEEHPDGWGRSDCFVCHPIFEIHRVDRTGTGLDLKAIREFVEEEGLDSCPLCHGDNGVIE